MNAPQKAQFDIDLAPPEMKEKTIDEQNAAAMKTLIGDKPLPKPVPLANRKRKK